MSKTGGLAVLVMVALVGCGDDSGGGTEAGDGVAQTTSTGGSGSSGSSDGGPMNALPTVEIETDAAAACGSDGDLVLRATLIGCVNPPPAPCTLPSPPRTYHSDTIACPATQSAAVMRVEIEQAGRFNVELVTTAADGSESTECYSDRDNPELIVDEPAFNTNPTIRAESLGGPC